MVQFHSCPPYKDQFSLNPVPFKIIHLKKKKIFLKAIISLLHSISIASLIFLQ